MIQKPRLPGRRVKPKSPLPWDKNLVNHKIIAPGAAQPYHLPSILDHRILNRQESHHRSRVRRRTRAGIGCRRGRARPVRQPAVDEQPIGVADAAGIIPTPAHPIPAGSRPRHPLRPKRPGAAKIRRPAEHIPPRLRRKMSGEQRPAVRQQRAPTHRTLRPGQLLHHLKSRNRVHLRPAHTGWQKKPVRPALRHFRRQPVRNTPQSVHFSPRRANTRRQVPGRRPKVGRFGRGVCFQLHCRLSVWDRGLIGRINVWLQKIGPANQPERLTTGRIAKTIPPPAKVVNLRFGVNVPPVAQRDWSLLAAPEIIPAISRKG